MKVAVFDVAAEDSVDVTDRARSRLRRARPRSSVCRTCS